MVVNYDKSKSILFSIDKRDLEIQFFRAGGKGGQNVNKVNSACRIIHRDSGARGECRNHRSQEQNKKEAFKRMAETKEFKNWVRYQTAILNGDFSRIEKAVDKSIDIRNLKIESVGSDGKWQKYIGDNNAD